MTLLLPSPTSAARAAKARPAAGRLGELNGLIEVVNSGAMVAALGGVHTS